MIIFCERGQNDLLFKLQTKRDYFADRSEIGMDEISISEAVFGIFLRIKLKIDWLTWLFPNCTQYSIDENYDLTLKLEAK